jgi:phage-related protein
MAISATEVINEQVLREVKTLSADLQEIKKSLAQLESSIAIIRSEVKALPTGLDWASEKRA